MRQRTIQSIGNGAVDSLARTCHGGLLAGRRASAFLLAAATCIALTPVAAGAQEVRPPLNVANGPDAMGWLRPTSTVSLVLSRPVDPDEGRLAVVIGNTDWRAQLHISGTVLELRPATVPLPSGEHEAVVYLVSADNTWRETARVPLRVLTAGGFEQADVRPSVVVGLVGKAYESNDPAAAPGPRGNYQDLTARFGLATRHDRDGWSTTSQVNVVGVSFGEEALRFGTQGDEAPLVDLADYSVRATHRRGSAAAGHTSWSSHRYLANGFSSRGLTGTVALGGAAEAAVSVLNGSSILGFGNPLGLSNSDHRVFGATLGVEAAPTRPGALRLTASFIDGSVLPQPQVNQGAIQDAETSRGFGLQVQAGDARRRLHVDGGLAWSRFVNPVTQPLFGQPDLVPVLETTRQARYLDASYAIVDGSRNGSTGLATVTAGLRYTRVDPLFRSVAASNPADLDQRAVDLAATVGPVTSQFTIDRARDNLDNLSSILTTRTRMTSWTTAVPIGALVRSGTGAWPTLSYAWQRTHQFGEGIPENSLFDSASQIPDQISASHVASLVWQGTAWRGGYTIQRTSQDNRQPGRELADFTHLTHGWSVGLSPTPGFDAGVDLALERATSLEVGRRDHTRRVGVNATWRPGAQSVLTGAISRHFSFDDPHTTERRAVDLHLQFSQSLVFRRGGVPGAQLFVRLARQTNESVFETTFTTQRRWAVSTGVTLTVF